MPRSRVPTAAELPHWLAAAAVRTARGRYRYDGEVAGGFGYFGAPPAVALVPEGAQVSFWHAAPRRWRLEVDGRLLLVTDGRRGLVREEGDWVRAREVLAPLGPADLLAPQPPHRLPHSSPDWQPDDWAVDGTVEQVEAAGRPAWRWARDDETWVVDSATGVALEHRDAGSTRVLLALEVDEELDDALFAVPEDLWAASRTVRVQLGDEYAAELGPERAAATVAEAEARAAAEVDAPQEDVPAWDEEEDVDVAEPWVEPAPGPVVGWWPRGLEVELVSGDPEVPAVLVQLPTGSGPGDGPDVCLGVARAGHAAPTRRGREVHRWDGDGWAFALSWRGPVDPAVVERVAASVPRAWDLA